jgi:L-iditol 2-dehydrogenase
MKIVSIESNKPIFKNILEPICGNNEVIIELKACGICGSDIGNIFGNSSMPTKKIGHEIAGKISNVGKNVNELKIDDRVIVNHHNSCQNCHFCLHGNNTMCEKFTEEIEPCGLSEKLLVSSWILKNGGVFKIPDKLSYKEAVLIEPFACCLRAWKKIQVKNSDLIVIFGFGTIGIFHSIIAKEKELQRIIVEPDKFRREFGRSNNLGEEFLEFNKDLKKYESKVDLCIIANPDVLCLSEAIKVIRKGGTILFFGEPQKNSRIEVDFSVFYSKELKIITSYSATNEDFIKAIKFISENQDKFSKLVSHEFSFNDAIKAINLAKNGENRIKVVVSTVKT